MNFSILDMKKFHYEILNEKKDFDDEFFCSSNNFLILFMDDWRALRLMNEEMRL